jgi:hypothetical protein
MEADDRDSGSVNQPTGPEPISGEIEAERLKREERALREWVRAFRAGGRLSRDEVHRRRRID